MARKIIAHSFQVAKAPFKEPLESWLRNQATTKSWLLAHALDGVIWGLVDSNYLETSHDVAPDTSPALQLKTLQQLRLFNSDYEVRLWRADDGWRAIRITDVPEPDTMAIEEAQLLWGTKAEPLSNGFIRLSDGTQGLVHIIPPFIGSEQLSGEIGAPSEKKFPIRRVYLKVRHYMTENGLGVNTITMSRLMGLGVEQYEQPTK